MSAAARAKRPPVMIRPDRAGWWAMLMLLGFLAVGLAALLFSYFHLLLNAGRWPPEGIGPPRFAVAAGSALAILAAALTIYLSVVQGVKGRRGRLKAGLGVASALGAAGLAVIFIDLTQVPFTAQTSVFGSLFFAMAGYSAVLILAGLAMLATVQLWVWMGFFGPSENIALVNLTLYWAFLAASWVPVFASLYLAPYLLGSA